MTPGARRPRVLLLAGSSLDRPGGTDTQLAAAVAEAVSDADFTWFTHWPHRGGSPPVDHGRQVPLPGVDGLPRRLRRPLMAAAGAALARHADLVHAVLSVDEGFPAFSRMLPPLLRGKPVLHTVPGVRDTRVLRRSRPLGQTVALSSATARELSSAGFGHVLVLPPVVRLERWPYTPRPSGPTPRVLVIGHVGPNGGAEEAVMAAGVAARAGARFRLTLALRPRSGYPGRSPAASLLALAEHEGLRDVEVLGHVPDMRALMASADVLLFVPQVLGARADVPLTVLEALSTGRPVILGDHPQFAVLGDTVLRAPVGDARRTGHLLRQLLDRPHWWQVLSEQGRATVEDRFGPERFAARYARLYRELLS
ncbi:glycosyltransferase family 4 protein [Streptomyces ficellus]|uniref:D-inositol 3-phosphate glycosyltransferase n=1 Tax=Streptomyces ficellus TaxID=1977088 RepID=A0A6I6FRA0_9ACTN|nr:glycosyltransferase [Streptomyces ficellus]QGV82069.1 glycosyltransferase family 1 protein [Streptomyces ficellus]